MEIDLDQRRLSLSVGEFADFSLGPRSTEGGGGGLWRAQLGTHWHQHLRERAQNEQPGARFELTIDGDLFHRGWTLRLQGRIDQWWPGQPPLLREIKTITAPLPLADDELRSLYPPYFLQLAAYQRLLEQDPGRFAELSDQGRARAELVFLELGSGLLQSVVLGDQDVGRFNAQLERVVEFLELRWQSRERLRRLAVRPPFDAWRPAQEQGANALIAAFHERPVVCFEAPTGFGKTGVLLHTALERLRTGAAERLVYLTAKGTGQWQVMETLRRMTATADGEPLAAWQVRPKSEHCIHTEFRCHREVCPHLRDLEGRWPASGLSRFYTLPQHPRSLEDLRAAGRAAGLCPFEITRSALPFNEVWVGDMNYVFAPSIRPLFFEQPGFSPERTLLVIDEAHHLPNRAADALSHSLTHDEALRVVTVLHSLRPHASLLRAWDNWAYFLKRLPSQDALSLPAEEDARDLLLALHQQIQECPIDFDQLDPATSEAYWKPVRVQQDLAQLPQLPRLWTCPTQGQLSLLCLEARQVVGPLLRSFAGVLLASATFGPENEFVRACGLDETDAALPEAKPTTPETRLGELTLRQTRKLFKGLQTGGALLRSSELEERLRPAWVRAEAPWRETAYQVAIDRRPDTRYQHRADSLPLTVQAVADLAAVAQPNKDKVAAFFPSFAYAESVRKGLAKCRPDLRVALQPRATERVDAAAWIERSLQEADVLFLTLGSTLAESIDALGGRVGSALVVGPALPEVNALQRAKLALQEARGRDAAFGAVYRIPGMQRVNQALGRLVRAPGQRARVVLHCLRFAHADYLNLLSVEYRTQPTLIASDAEWQAWLQSTPNDLDTQA